MGQNLDGQTLVGEPFSYVGGCSLVGTVFTGDWKHTTFYNNTGAADFRQAETRWSYSRGNTVNGWLVSPDVESTDYDMMKALFMENLPKLSANVRQRARDILDDIQARYGIVSWQNRVPPWLDAFGGDRARALTVLRTLVGNRPHLVDRYLGSIGLDRNESGWVEDERRGTWGVSVPGYRKALADLPRPILPHDRWEMADLIVADAALVGVTLSLYIHSIAPWRCFAVVGAHTREELARL